MYNLITQHRIEKVKGGDTNATISYLRGKAGNDRISLADGTSRIDYDCFGNVLTFDSTYNRNVYNNSLVIFSSSNHHGHTVIFGCGLLVNKDIGLYKWILETFLKAMGNKHLMHLHRNACEKVKNSEFLNDFKKLIYANVSVEQFEVMWGDMVAMNNERVAEFNSKYTNPVLVTSLSTLEAFGAKTFTRNMFREVKKEIEGACALNIELVIQDDGKLYLKCNSFRMPEIYHVVEFDRIGGMLRCECLWFENQGLPCMHIFACLKHQHIEVTSERLVCKQWTKNGKSDFMKSNVDDPSDSDKVLKCHLGMLGVECSRLMDVACKNSSDFVEAMNDIANTITKLQKRGENSRNGNLDDDYVIDPLVEETISLDLRNEFFPPESLCMQPWYTC
ncbi:protein FAR1-RELATED SEQUENCE 5-like [Arachis stenosperma]|uniref:protein FAR1-RELATED SEQUENCE 5-like n=1 Tax=Arachis stenosperma TaxID=217475 RepID=UPI0025ACB8D6|nr:protein FAR1-RELATED SEQUENCE 5-like [Arachis stenosperma]